MTKTQPLTRHIISINDGPGASADILRGPLRGHLRMTDND